MRVIRRRFVVQWGHTAEELLRRYRADRHRAGRLASPVGLADSAAPSETARYACRRLGSAQAPRCGLLSRPEPWRALARTTWRQSLARRARSRAPSQALVEFGLSLPV